MTTNSRANLLFPYRRPARNARVRLFCLPYAGGAASIYRSWPEQLPSEIDVWAIQLPGRENRLGEKPIEQIMDMVNILLPELLPYLDVPYAFFGHSMGASIGFELIRALPANFYPAPLHLFVSGRCSPQVKRDKSFRHDLPEAEFIEELRRLEGTPEKVLRDPELLQILLPILRADFKLSETYTYQEHKPLLSFPISAYGGLQDIDITRKDLETWQKETTGPFKLRMFPGSHFFLHSAQALVLQMLARDLLTAS